MKNEFENIQSVIESISKQSIIAVTGPMAAGKNYICSQLEKEGWSCVDADILVHDAIELVKDKILAKFVPFAEQQHIKLTNPDGTIDRKALGRLLFAFPELLNIQESIVYPIIIKQIEEFIVSHPKAAINATVLYKTPEILKHCQKVIYVTAPFFKRLQRAHKRDKMSFYQIIRRFYVQRNLLKQYQKFLSPEQIIIIKNI